MRWWVTLLLLWCNILHADPRCPLADLPPPPNRPADFQSLVLSLKSMNIDTSDGELYTIFFSTPPKTKLEQFFRLLYYIQKQHKGKYPLVASPPGIATTLLAAKVFADPSFPNRILSVSLNKDNEGLNYIVHIDQAEARFPLNQGRGFAVWEHGKCQVALELVFYDGFGFRLGEKDRNLVVEDFSKVQLYGDFGSRGLFDIDLNYVDLERVEFIDGTDQGRVKSRVADREFKTNPHSFLFRFVGRMIPDHSRQRIDW